MQITPCYWLRKKQYYRAWLISYLKLEETMACKISRQPTPFQIKIDKELVENVEEFIWVI
jgi:hypothetical protein